MGANCEWYSTREIRVDIVKYSFVRLRVYCWVLLVTQEGQGAQSAVHDTYSRMASVTREALGLVRYFRSRLHRSRNKPEVVRFVDQSED